MGWDKDRVVSECGGIRKGGIRIGWDRDKMGSA